MPSDQELSDLFYQMYSDDPSKSWVWRVTQVGSNNDNFYNQPTYRQPIDIDAPNVCQRKPGWLSGDKGAFLSWYVINKDPVIIDRACKKMGKNLEQQGWGGYTGGMDRAVCRVVEPENDVMKRGCCIDNPSDSTNTVDYCSVDWCKGQDKCTNWLNDWCQRGTNMLTDNEACADHRDTNAPLMGRLCADPANFRSQVCKDFCNQQVNITGISSTACLTSAKSYCDAKSNFSDPECACINYDKSDDYTTNIKQFPTLTTTNYQCWGSPCGKATANWSDLMSSINRTGTGSGICPSTLQICDQTMNLSDISAQSLGSISQTCNLSSSSSTTTNVTLPPGSVASNPAAPGSFASDPAAPGVTTSPGVTGFFSSLFSSTKSSDSSSTTPSKTTTYIGLGGLSFCSSLSCLLLIILLIFMMSK